jgi:hypothetical protein
MVRLIALLLSSHIQAFLRDKFAHDPDIDTELSEWKAMALLKKTTNLLQSIVWAYVELKEALM